MHDYWRASVQLLGSKIAMHYRRNGDVELEGHKIVQAQREREKKLDECLQNYLSEGRSTAELAYDKAESAITELYGFVGLKRPRFVYCDSPFHMSLEAAGLFRRLDKNGEEAQVRLETQFQALLDSRLKEISAKLARELEPSTLASLEENLRLPLHAQLVQNLHHPVTSQFLDHTESKDPCAFEAYRWSWLTQWSLDRLAIADFGRKHILDMDRDLTFDPFVVLCLNTHAILPLESVCFISRRPALIRLNDVGQLHCNDGPSISYADGYELFKCDGVSIRWRNVFDLGIPLIDKDKRIEMMNDDYASLGEVNSQTTIAEIAAAAQSRRLALVRRYMKIRCPQATEIVRRLVATLVLDSRLESCLVPPKIDPNCSGTNQEIKIAMNKKGLHSLMEPAIVFPDGYALYCLNGTIQQPYVVEHPEEITVGQIVHEMDSEVRQELMFQYLSWRYGLHRLVTSISKEGLKDLFDFSQERVTHFLKLYGGEYALVADQELFCLFNERPVEIRLNPKVNSRPIAEGAAVTLGDGSHLYTWKGRLTTSENILLDPSSITVQFIDKFNFRSIDHQQLTKLYLNYRYQLPSDQSQPRDDMWSLLYQHYKRRMQERGHDFLDVEEWACIIDERPIVINIDEHRRLHCESGPAVEYMNGDKLYAWHGLILNTEHVYLIEEPELITVNEIDDEENTEIRRIMVERFGSEKYLEAGGAIEINSDEYGTLFCKNMLGDESLMMVRVRNSTPEPDGSYKHYFLRVPPFMTTAKRGIAWTFGLSEEDYQPNKET